MTRRIVECAQTGEIFIFDDAWNDADGRVRQVECELKGHRRVPPHFHPNTAQTFEVVSGLLWLRIGKQTLVLRAGEQITAQAGDLHAQWNERETPVRVIERYDPPLDIEPYLTLLPRALASRNPFKRAIFRADFRPVTNRRGWRARLWTNLLARIGRLLGLGGWYGPRASGRRS